MSIQDYFTLSSQTRLTKNNNFAVDIDYYTASRQELLAAGLQPTCVGVMNASNVSSNATSYEYSYTYSDDTFAAETNVPFPNIDYDFDNIITYEEFYTGFVANQSMFAVSTMFFLSENARMAFDDATICLQAESALCTEYDFCDIDVKYREMCQGFDKVCVPYPPSPPYPPVPILIDGISGGRPNPPPPEIKKWLLVN